MQHHTLVQSYVHRGNAPFQGSWDQLGSAFEFRRREERRCHLLGAYCIPGPVLGAFHGPSYTPESSQVTWLLLFPFYRRDGEMPQELEN